jgi:PAS domain S-box-containing protein
MAVAFCIYAFLLLANSMVTHNLLKTSLQERLMTDSLRRAEIIKDHTDMHLKKAVELAQSQQITAYLANKALGMSEHYGLFANLSAIENNFQHVIQTVLFRKTSVFQQITFYDEHGTPLVDVGSIGPPIRLPPECLEEPRLLIDENAEIIVTCAPVYSKGLLHGIVMVAGKLEILSGLLISNNGNTHLYQELLVSDEGTCVMPRKTQTHPDDSFIKNIIKLPENSIIDLDTVSEKPEYLHKNMVLRTLVAGTPLSLVTLFKREQIEGGEFSTEYLCTFAAFPLILLFWTIFFHIQRRNNEKLQYDNSLLNEEIQRRITLEQTLREKGEYLELTTTELTKAKELIETNEAQLSAITSSANDAILMMDPQGNISFWNPAAQQILGYCADEAIDHNLHQLLAPPDLALGCEVHIAEFARSGKGLLVGKTTEMQARRKDGAEIPISLSMSAVQLNGQWYAVGILRDISEIKQTQHQLEHLNRSLCERVETAVTELRQKDQVLISQNRQAAMGEMIGNIAHQWRQPLNALSVLMANLQFAHLNSELTEPLMKESTNTAHRLIQKMSTTIDDFRNFFRPDKEKTVFSALEQVNLTVQMVEKAFCNNSITIVINTGNDCSLWGFANEFSQVLLNLLSNARDAIVARGIPSGTIIVAAREENGMGVVTVHDNGGGIPEAILDKIFDPYFSTKETGTGIGLYMSKMIIERSMGGHITVDHFGDGCRFTLAVPLASTITGTTVSATIQ